MKVLVDMNLSPRWVGVLEEAGFSATHWATVGAASAPDSEVMSFAKANELIVLTHDLDFSAMLAQTGDDGPSVLQIRSDDLNLHAIGSAVLSALREIEARPMQHLLVTVHPKRTRVRILPFPKLR